MTMNPSYKKTLTAIVVAAFVAGVAIFAVVLISSKPISEKPATSTSMTAAASLALTSAPTGSVDVGELQHIRWTSSNYASPTVSLNIIRKVSDSPARYELVRQVASATANDGDAVWVPAPGDVGPDTYVEIGCVESIQPCTAMPLPLQPVVVENDGRYANTASVFQATEAEYNN